MKNAHLGLLWLVIFVTISLIGGFRGLPNTYSASSTQNISSKVIISNAAPTVSGVTLNSGNPIVLTAASTTQVQVSFTIQDNNGCGDALFNGRVTSSIYRSGVSSTCMSGQFNYSSCYLINSYTTHTCPFATSSQTTVNATATFNVYYFADATDASSSYAAQNWIAEVRVVDAGNSSSTATSTGIELNTLTALSLPTSSLDFGTVTAGQNTSSTNQTVEVFNVGNSSNTLNVYGTDLTSGGNTIAVGNLHYATSSFTYGGVEKILSAVSTGVSGWLANSGPIIRSWQTNSMNTGFGNHASIAWKNYLYNLGGYQDDALTSTVKFAAISPTGTPGVWTSTTPIPASNAYHTTVVSNGYIYTIGGQTSGGVTSSVWYTSQSATGSLNAWTSTAALPDSVNLHASAVSNGYMYVLGGAKIGGSSPTTTVYFTSINSTGSLNAWTSTTPLPATNLSEASVIWNGYIYVIGGTANNNPTSTVWYAPINATGSLGAWTANSVRLPVAVSDHESIVSNGNLYVFGGKIGGSVVTSTVWYAPINATASVGRWVETTALPSALVWHAIAQNNGLVYITGGSSDEFTSVDTVYYGSISSQNTTWGMGVPNGTPTGTYSGTVTYVSVFTP